MMLSTVKDFLKRSASISYFLTLFLLAFGVLSFFSMFGCSSCDSSTPSIYVYSTTTSALVGKGMANVKPPSSYIMGFNYAYDKGDVRGIYLSSSTEGGGDMEMVWTPPKGSSDFNFSSAAKQPEPGGPPFIFKNVPSGTSLEVHYTLPNNPDPKETSFTDTLVSTGPTGTSTSTLTGTYGQKQSSPSIGQPPAALSASEDWPSPWEAARFVDFSVPLTAEMCQDFIDYGQSDKTFYLYRLPVPDQQVVGDNLTSRTLPVYSESGVAHPKSPKFVVLGGMGTSAEFPMEVRAETSAWANQNLPAEEGEAWVALGLKKDASLSCSSLAFGGTSYSVVGDVFFDFSSEPGECLNCTLPSYACYQSEAAASSPLVRRSIQQRLEALSGGGDALEAPDGVVCISGSPTLLNTGADWRYEPYTASLTLEPGDPFVVHHWIENHSDSSRAFNLTFSSNLPGADWKIYQGNFVDNICEPDLSKPVTTSISVPANSTKHLCLTSTTPAGTDGMYSVSLKAASAAASPTEMAGTTELLVNGPPPIVKLTPELEVSGQPASLFASPGGNITYTFTLRNTGGAFATNLVLSDTLPQGVSYVSCGGGDTCRQADGVVTWELALLEAGKSQDFSLVVSAGAELYPGSEVYNADYQADSAETDPVSGERILVIIGEYRRHAPILRSYLPPV